MHEQKTIDINVGDNTLHFAIDDAGFNRFLNDQSPTDKLTPAFNMLSQSVVEADKALFKKYALADDGVTVRGAIVMQIAGLIGAEFGGGLEISIKKPSAF